LQEQKNEWLRLGMDAPPRGLVPIFTSSAGKKDSPGGAEEVELRTPVTKGNVRKNPNR